MGLIPDLKVWGINEVLTAPDLNGVVATIKDTVNQSALFKDVAGTVTAAHTFSVAQTFTSGLTSAGTVSVTGGGQFTGNGAGLTNLNPGALAGGVLADAVIPGLNATKIVTGTLDPARVPDLDAAKIATGVLLVARIPDLPASKVQAGTFAGAFTFSSALTGAGFVSTGLDRSQRTTGTATSGTYAINQTTNAHRVTLANTGAVTLTLGVGTPGQWHFLEVLQGTGTPVSYSFGGAVTYAWSNGGGPLPTIVANRKDTFFVYYSATNEVLITQVHQNLSSTS